MLKNTLIAVILPGVLLFSGCQPQQDNIQEGIEGTEQANVQEIQTVSEEQLSLYTEPLQDVVYPEKGIIALGEATHGNSGFTELKQSVFQQLVEQQHRQAFVLEGDFGGSLKVNDYIQGGEGTASEAVSAIGFAIYRTEEMVQLVEWMRSYNEGRQEEDRIRFYGFDMQRYDRNKEGLLAVLNQAVPDLAQEYQVLLADVSDDTMYDLEPAACELLLKELDSLFHKLEAQKDIITGSTSAREFDLALQYATCIRQNTELRLAGNKYGTLRDSFMAEKVSWVLQYEAMYYDNEKIFITGHNGHIGKETATFGTEQIMGELLAAAYGNEYFAIGAEFYESTFLAANAMTGEREVYTVRNDSDGRLALLFHNLNMPSLYFDLQQAAEDEALSVYLNTKQYISSIGDAFSGMYAASEKMYAQNLTPAKSYDAMIFIDTLQPSSMLDDR